MYLIKMSSTPRTLLDLLRATSTVDCDTLDVEGLSYMEPVAV